MTGRMMRRAFLKRGFAAAVGAAAAGSLEALRPLAYIRAAEPIRIGFIADITGTVAQSGRDMLDGFQLYLAEKGSTMAGRPVQLIVEDAAGVPANALTKARKLVEEDHVHLLTAPLLASEGYAIEDYISGRGVPSVFCVCSADDLTQRKHSPVIIRTGWSSSQPSHPFGEWVYSNLKYKRIATIGSDYAFGYEVVGGFQHTFELKGGEIVQKIWAPLGTPDYSPYVTRLRRDVDAVFAIPVGADAGRFVKAYREYGLKGKIPLIGGGVLMDESLVRGMDAGDAAGTITALHWAAGLTRPEAQRFVQAYNAKFNKDPSYYAETNYSGARWIHAAVEHIDGKVEDSGRLLAALRAVQLPDAPRGPMRLDEYQNVVHNIYIRKVENRGGHAVNTVIYTYHNVSQFWTFQPKAFLGDPVYNRDYPPCRYCA